DARIARQEGAPGYGNAGRGNTVRQTFAAMTQALDRNVGRILNALDESGQAENTLLVFHSDNGGSPKHGGDNTPLRGAKFTTWEGGTRVVSLLCWPAKTPGGRVFAHPTCYLDLLPTFAAAAAAEAPEGLDGLDLLPMLASATGAADLPDRVLLLGKDAAVSTRWKLRGGQLFDLIEDPNETRDIAAQHPGEVQRLSNALKAFPAMKGPRVTSALAKPAEWPPAEWKLPVEP
ncbi:MAG: sulfatase-like hydrolase/transferase, partial [Planctomycetota bacterium]